MIYDPAAMASLKATIEAKVAKLVADAQSAKDWLGVQLPNCRFSRTEAGTVKIALVSPFTGREIVAETFPLRKFCERAFIEAKAANWQGIELAAWTDDLLDACLLRDIKL